MTKHSTETIADEVDMVILCYGYIPFVSCPGGQVWGKARLGCRLGKKTGGGAGAMTLVFDAILCLGLAVGCAPVKVTVRCFDLLGPDHSPVCCKILFQNSC